MFSCYGGVARVGPERHFHPGGQNKDSPGGTDRRYLSNNVTRKSSSLLLLFFFLLLLVGAPSIVFSKCEREAPKDVFNDGEDFTLLLVG